MSVETLLNTTSSRELAEWAAFLTVERELHEEGPAPPENAEDNLRRVFGRPQ